MIHSLSMPSPGELKVKKRQFRPNRFLEEITDYQYVDLAGSPTPVVVQVSEQRLNLLQPLISRLADTVVKKVEQANKIYVKRYDAAFIICAADVIFPAHIDKARSRRATLELTGSVGVREYDKNQYEPGEIITEPGVPVHESSLNPGGILLVNNVCEPEVRRPHDTVTESMIEGANRVALAITMFTEN